MVDCPTGIVRSLREVALEFGVSLNTVKTNWRRAGMPGQRGHWDLAVIAQWKQSRSRDNQSPSASVAIPTQQRKLEAEARIKEAEAIAKERANELAKGNTLQRADVERLFSQMLTLLRDLLMRVPEDMKGSFPQKRQDELGGELRKRLDLVLLAVHDLQNRLQEIKEE